MLDTDVLEEKDCAPIEGAQGGAAGGRGWSSGFTTNPSASLRVRVRGGFALTLWQSSPSISARRGQGCTLCKALCLEKDAGLMQPAGAEPQGWAKPGKGEPKEGRSKWFGFEKTGMGQDKS